MGWMLIWMGDISNAYRILEKCALKGTKLKKGGQNVEIILKWLLRVTLQSFEGVWNWITIVTNEKHWYEGCTNSGSAISTSMI
jgi:hypothetical protein